MIQSNSCSSVHTGSAIVKCLTLNAFYRVKKHTYVVYAYFLNFSDLKQSRMRILELLPDPHHDVPKMETAIKLYFSLLRGFLEFTTSEGSTSASKLRHGVRFRWTQSLLGTVFSMIFPIFHNFEGSAIACRAKRVF